MMLFTALLTAAPALSIAPAACFADEPGDAIVVPGDLVHYTVSGKRFLLSDYIAVPGSVLPPVPDLEGPVVLLFGAHWCEPCKDVVAELSARESALRDAGVTLIYVHVDDRDRSDGLDQKAIQAKAREMAKKPGYEAFVVTVGGDMEEVRTWMDDPEWNALPGVVLATRGGKIASRSGADKIGAALDEFLTNNTPSDDDKP